MVLNGCLFGCCQLRKWEELLEEEKAMTKDFQNQLERKALQERQQGFEVR